MFFTGGPNSLFPICPETTNHRGTISTKPCHGQHLLNPRFVDTYINITYSISNDHHTYADAQQCFVRCCSRGKRHRGGNKRARAQPGHDNNIDVSSSGDEGEEAED